MQISFSTLFVLALAGIATATPTASTASVAFPGDGASVAITKRSGCGSVGPLGTGHFIWWITASCTPGAATTCQATGADGCEPGNPNKIGSMEVDDPNDTVQYAKQSHTNSVGFTCPQSGQVRCQANFNDNNDGPNYSLRVF